MIELPNILIGIGLIIVLLLILKISLKKETKVDLSFLDPDIPKDYPIDEEKERWHR